MARIVWFQAFRDRPPKMNCGHRHKTASAASRCAVRRANRYGGRWLITSGVVQEGG